ncbi:NADH-quinone oxidoreductase subunit E [Mesorhizobium soli]|jgi:NADH-quinone oxidoreductase subunit E|uniref:NADH-ubiquinone dehydrogenase n=1 Tax=Pseudaminobacter soli (ex Li et al. 2025) TaxID=1295366 RepID=UPI002476D87E|nr:NADH-ubiquinone dehydrogenase [Mesorhizobium soli]MDH6232592.1 NADH-quinone oxidoreductase subunit E [Mesorhizobium soli]
MPEAERWEKMNEQFAAMLPKELAGAVNMMAHPAAGAVAFSAMGFGMASHAIGVWMGAVAGVAQASQRMMVTLADEDAGEVDAFAVRSISPTAMVRAAAKTLMADVRAVRRDVDEVADSLAEGMTRPRAIARPAEPEDLKKIAGVGLKLELALNREGIWSLAQVAEWGEAEIAWLDEHLGLNGRIGRDDWVGQAIRLATEETKH